MTDYDVVLRAARVVRKGGEGPAAIAIRDGRIADIGEIDAFSGAARDVEFGSEVAVLPGLVDSHVHVCDPGTDWEGFETATRSAAAGGITTLVDMPIDSFPPTTTVDGLVAKRRSAEGRCYVDVGFWGGAVPENLAELPALREQGVLGFKCFMIDPGVPDFSPLTPKQVEQALAITGELRVPLLIHAESADVAARIPPLQTTRRFRDYLASRPDEMETKAIADVIGAAQRTGGHAHVLHLSSAEGLAMIVEAQQRGVYVTAETCPHYLTTSKDEIADGATLFKCSPPIRDRANRDRLWDGIRQGQLAMIVSDHSPCTVAMKHLDTGDFSQAWGGIASLQVSLPLVWTEARRRGHSLVELARWMAEHPARLAKLPHKGQIEPGFDADFCVLAADEELIVDPAQLQHRHPVTPYGGRRLTGVVRETWLRGRRLDLRQPTGRLLRNASDAAAQPMRRKVQA